MTEACWSRKKNGVEIYQLSDLENSFPPHFHKFGLVGKLLTGKRVLRINGQPRLLSAGDIAIIKPGEVHSCVRLGDEPNIWLAVAIPAQFFQQTNIPSFPALNKAYSRHLDELFKNLESDGDPQLLIKCLSSLEGEITLPGSQDKRFAVLLNEMERRIPNKFDMEEMARLAKMDKYGLIRKFSAVFCLTPHKYMSSLRVAHGCDLLSRGKAISDCALRTGFYDQSHFTLLFHRYMGATPAVYKKAGEVRIIHPNVLPPILPEVE